MAKKRGSVVDAEIQLAIEDGNNTVIKELRKDLKENTAEIKEFIDLHTKHIEKDVERLRDDVNDLYNKDRDMRDRVGVLEQRQSNDEGHRTGEDKATGRKFTDREQKIGTIAIIVSILSLGAGFLIALL